MIEAKPFVEVFLEPLGGRRAVKSTKLTVDMVDFEPDLKWRKRPKNQPAKSSYVIIGFDTEYKTPDHPLELEEIKDRKGNYEVLSYQFHCETSSGQKWSGIACPENDQRMSFGEYLVFALASGIRGEAISVLPRTIYLVGHFTKADVPAFADFQDLTKVLSSVRNTFISIDRYVAVDIKFNKTTVRLKVYLRDTMLLTPATSKSLSALGELVGVPKIILDSDPSKELYLKQNMDVLRRDNWSLFRQYALNDAVICVEYLKRMIELYHSLTGKLKVPVTLTSIGVDLLIKSWVDELGAGQLDILGKEKIVEERWDKKKGYYVKLQKEVSLKECYWQEAFVTECFHGGRNEQFWFGPCFEDVWTDFDLSSAYATTMSLIGRPNWKKFKFSKRLKDYSPQTLGFACVTFKFPKTVRYPTMPVRTVNGLVFPMEGTTNCSAPEIVVAKGLGAELTIHHGVIIPTDNSVRVFGRFIKECLEKRRQHPKGSLNNLFWKEVANSTYGKTAQGLREKRVYDMRDRETKILPPSKITNPFFAAYITSFVRAVLGEIINSLPQSVLVFSCTTDGFLTNATDQQMGKAQKGPLAKIFAETRKDLTGEPVVLEKKHSIRLPLGWRTRGQATLKEGPLKSDDKNFHIVLAKGGIYTRGEYDTEQAKNELITKMFFNRQPDNMIQMEVKTGIRDMVDFDSDLVDKKVEKRLNMEFDWKRAPYAIGSSTTYNHVVFSTSPWQNVEQFQKIREIWQQYQKKNPTCIKTIDQYQSFATFAETVGNVGVKNQAYIKKKNGDVLRLRVLLCSAWRNSLCGFVWDPDAISAAQFARLLNQVGIPCDRSHVEYGLRRAFKPNSCPPTVKCKKILNDLKATFPKLQINKVLSGADLSFSLTPRAATGCRFVKQVS